MTDTRKRLIGYEAIKNAIEDWGMDVSAKEFRGFVIGIISATESQILTKNQEGIKVDGSEQQTEGC